ncbi:dioxygenase family protein [Piscinibacter sakaiensis]|uniref:Putative cytoplasmic protein n=1 Tax=Piscinibacter sakaiensis TaxID=1547922 RepID=A0A0K8P792_PISS1|nr:class III extradiol ring-cleavage dioxygenase [Piscinibacter sakaiensis]GAP38533.1 putative cytoplasmic protein [Piscinibacter sakaiensis]
MDTPAPALPPLFVSHGSPMIALEPGDAGRFLQRLGQLWRRRYGPPAAILAVSAHTAARVPVLLAAPRHAAVYDFGDFDPALFRLRYDAPGAPALARALEARLRDAGQPVQRVDDGGLDHGSWTVLRYLFPDADVPVLPLAYVPDAPPAAQFALGAALAPLAREGVLVLGSGSITHNLRRVFAQGLHAPAAGRPEVPESAAFRAWMQARSSARDWEALFDYRRRAPHALDMHPSDEHLLPWYVAAGAGGRDAAPQRLHASVTHGCLGMDAYAFGPEAAALRAAVDAVDAEADAAARPAASAAQGAPAAGA